MVREPGPSASTGAGPGRSLAPRWLPVAVAAAMLMACTGDGSGDGSVTPSPFSFRPIRCDPATSARTDGELKVAFVGFEPGAVEPSVYAVPQGERAATRLVTLQEDLVRGMAWSPDGSSLAIAGGGSLIVAGSDGSELSTLFNGRTVVTSPAWSPMGEWIAFAAGAEGNLQEFQRYTPMLVRPNGSELHAAAAVATDGSRLSWSPDGRWLAFAGFDGQRLDIVAAPVGGGSPRRLTQAVQSATSPDWSPDCTSIAYVAGDVGGDDLRAVRLDGSGDRVLVDTPRTEPPSNVRTPVWSPDGSWVAFYQEIPEAFELPDPELFVMPAEGSEPLQLTSHEHGVNDGLTWSADSSSVLYGSIGVPPVDPLERPGGTGWSMWMVGIEGTDRTRIVAEGVEDAHAPVLATPD